MAKFNTPPGHFSGAIIDNVESTSDRLTGRAGLTLFVRYLRAIGIFEPLDRLFGSLRKSRKGQPVTEIFKQLLCFFMDGTSRHLTYFDALQEDEGYAGTIESRPNAMLSSHAVKRFFQSFFMVRVWLFRRILQQLFLWRLGLRQPEVIVLGVDSMVMDNNEAQKREGVKATYRRVKGFHPLQITWSRFIVDAVFRGGDKHCNDKETVIKALTHLIGKIRKQYRTSVPIIVRMDSGFFDEKIMAKLDELEVGYLIAGKLYDDIKAFIGDIDESSWRRYQNGKQEWSYVEFGDRRGAWKRFRRVVFSRPLYEDRQRLLEFARPDQIIYTNLGLGDAVDGLCHHLAPPHFRCSGKDRQSRRTCDSQSHPGYLESASDPKTLEAKHGSTRVRPALKEDTTHY